MKASRSVGLAAVTAAAALATQSGVALPPTGDTDPIEGVWDFTAIRRDCTGGAVLGTQRTLSVFHRGGTFSNDNSMPPATHGAMFGTWKRGKGSAYAVNMVFMRFNADGTLAGTQRIQRSMTLAVDGNNIVGEVVARTVDAAGIVTAQGCASETGIRVF